MIGIIRLEVDVQRESVQSPPFFSSVSLAWERSMQISLPTICAITGSFAGLSAFSSSSYVRFSFFAWAFYVQILVITAAAGGWWWSSSREEPETVVCVFRHELLLRFCCLFLLLSYFKAIVFYIALLSVAFPIASSFSNLGFSLRIAAAVRWIEESATYIKIFGVWRKLLTVHTLRSNNGN